MAILISINSQVTGKLPPGDPRWATFNDSFVHRDLEPVDLANEIYTGHAYAGLHQGRRCLENFIAAQHIAVDMDTGDERSAMPTLLQHDLVRMYGGIVHTTPSHSDEHPRARVIFFLDKPICDTTQYQAAAKFLAEQFDGADTAVTDASRFFYGSKGCALELLGFTFPLGQLRHFWRRWNALNAPMRRDGVIRMETYRKGANVDSRAVSAPHAPNGAYDFARVVDPVRVAMNGNRNNVLNHQAFLAGKDIRAGRVSESEAVSRLLSAATDIGLPESEALRTIQSGIRSGMAKGRVA